MDWLAQLDPVSIYLAIGTMLVLAGVGLPFPEEICVIASGILLAQGLVTLHGVVLTLAIGIVGGDTAAYLMGRTFGMKLANYPPFRWALTEKHLERVQYEFRKHHVKAIFFGRLIMGVRFVTMIVAGMSRVPLWKFILLDASAASLTTPVTVSISYVVGDPERAKKILKSVDLIIAAVVVVALSSVWVVIRYRDRWKGPGKGQEGSDVIEEATNDAG
ncbi:Inner membrane protein YohD [Planctomycetes bacterium Pan216]|uniref:Inner membrane protein YohD n=1 Tax=Kolteria novifilia TaxID=2527975 RepID=A0A518AZT1_9BACT|nr:Inner membrane protein YohD [Planctomycetes bacterium Pan216]